MKQLKEIIEKSAQFLEQKGIASARLQAEELIADVLKLKRIDLYLQFDRPLNEEELDQCRKVLKKRADGTPSQYIRGYVEFLNCKILVDPRVLIPRQETEILASKVIEQLEKEEYKDKTLVDLCCGSGCIGIAIKKKLPELNVLLSDLSTEALKVAKKNAEINQVDVSFVQGDLLDQKTNYVVCNPPYVSEEEFESLDREVKDHEPKMALVAGNQGLEFYERLSRGLSDCLEPPGKVWFEIGKDQGAAVMEIFKQPIWKNHHIENDWAGHQRFFFLEKE